MDAITAASARGDGVSARIALEEARELRPEAPELAEVEARVARLPVVVPAAAPGFFQSRTFGAVALLGVGVALLTALDTVRSVESPIEDPVAVVSPAFSPAVSLSTTGRGDGPVFDPEPPPTVAEAAEEPEEVLISVADAVVPDTVERAPDTAGRAIGTAGLDEPAAPPRPPPPAREAISDQPAVQRALLVEPVPAPEPLPRAEIPDDLVVLPSPQPRREAIVASPVLSRESRGSLLVRPPSVTGSDAGTRETAAAPAVAAVRDETLVSSVLDLYVRAYDSLDASAAREVWPTVDERALARAFAGLESQHLTFNNCSIDVRGEVANASCRGLASYVGKVGSRQPRTEPRRWTFELRRDGEAWKIASAQTALLQ